mmetsp:Transcript_21288/g.32451  ORF Transcript_21288/g.32451 Transcript_21288/m.32451 type:complete len:294 (-) Transcript_21288:1014-1895(-)
MPCSTTFCIDSVPSWHCFSVTRMGVMKSAVISFLVVGFIQYSDAYVQPRLSRATKQQGAQWNYWSKTADDNSLSSVASSFSFSKLKYTRLCASDSDNNNDTDASSNILSRFTSPRIDDRGLPLADALVAQIVAPSFQILWLSLAGAPRPTWLAPIFSSGQLFATRGSLLAPTLIHGAGLASCWIAGALAGRAFETEAFDVSDEVYDGQGFRYGSVIGRTLQAGAFATGLLIMSTQCDLFLEYGRYVQPGESEEIDLRLLTALVELINDIFFEFAALFGWRIYRASVTVRPDRD